MKLKIKQYIEHKLLSGYPEYDAIEKDISLEEEKIVVARLVLAQQIDYFSITEHMDFQNFEQIKPILTQGFTKCFGFFIVLVLVVAYGIIQFAIKASEDETLKPLEVFAMFSLTQCYHPPAQVAMYFWKSKNMAKLVNQYINTFRPISENSREFYRSLALKRNIFKYFVRIGTLWLLFVNLLFGNTCSNKDLRFVCGALLPIWYPIETNYFPVREIIEVFFVFLAWGICMMIVYQSIDAYILAELFEFKCQNLIRVMQKTSLDRVQNLETVRQNFRNIVDYHQDLKLCVDLIRDILGGISAPALTVFIPTAAALSTAFVKAFNLAYFSEFLTIVIFLYLCIDSIQRITDMGETIQQAAYDMDWYEMDREMNKEYMIFLMKLQLPLELRSILFVVKKPMYLSMMRSAYSFFMLMLQMN